MRLGGAKPHPNQSNGAASSFITHGQSKESSSSEKVGHKRPYIVVTGLYIVVTGLYTVVTGLYLLFLFSPVVLGPCKSFVLTVPTTAILQRCSILSDFPSPISPAHVWCFSLSQISIIYFSCIFDIGLSIIFINLHPPATSVANPGEKSHNLEMGTL